MYPSHNNKKGFTRFIVQTLILLVPEVGIEPTWGCPRWILSPVRLPVSPLRLKTCSLSYRTGLFAVKEKAGPGGLLVAMIALSGRFQPVFQLFPNEKTFQVRGFMAK